MKKFALFGIFLFAGICTLQAQKEQTLFGKSGARGGFGGVYLLFSQAGGEPGGGGGIDGAWIVDHFFVGGFLQMETFGQRRISNRNYNLGLFGTGLWMGYVYPSHKVVHLYTSAKLGLGNAVLARRDNDPFDNDDFTDGIAIFAPEIGAELNLARWLRLSMTIGHRWVSGANDLPGTGNRDLNSFFLGISARAGVFGHK